MKNYYDLREEYKTFTFESYNYSLTENSLNISYLFSIDNLSFFEPAWVLPKTRDIEYGDETIEKLVFSLGLVELVSYWKITCCKNVKINCGHLSKDQINWWKKQYFYGLGEFFYINKIEPDFDDFMTIETAPEKPFSGKFCGAPLDGCLVPVGGGKDSALTLEILKSGMEKDKISCYIINPRGATDDTAIAAGIDEKNVFTASRTLDKNMLYLNRCGYLNGHTPFSAIVAFSSVLTAYLTGKKYVVLSNESSANESTVKSTKINHQYSKSFDFEYDFSTYEKEYIDSGVYYFSLLRPLSEYQIARLFAKNKQYHRVFKSCNVGSKKNIWCCGCSKCLFVYLILSPFLSSDELKNIFGENLLEKPDLLPYFDALIGKADEKPFECVGSRGEVNEAVCTAIENMQKSGEDLPFMFKHYIDIGFYKNPTKKYDNYYNGENLLPEEFKTILANVAYGGTVPQSEDTN